MRQRHAKFGRQIGAPLRFVFASRWQLDLLPVIQRMRDDMDAYLECMHQRVLPTVYARARASDA